MTSFNEALGSMAWQWYQQLREGNTDPVLQLLVSKSAHHKLLNGIGVPHAQLLHTVTSQTLAPEHLSVPCVLEPDRGATGIGVTVLVPGGPGQWRDDRAGRTYDMTSIRDRMRWVLSQNDGHPDEWLVEELMVPREGRGLIEYGCYVFGGVEVPLVRAGRTVGGRTCKRWFTVDGEPVVVERPGWMFPVDDGLPGPRDMAELLGVARMVAAAVPTPFLRVDVYDTTRGLVVSEVNPTDGYRAGFVSDWDRILGQLLDEAKQLQVGPQ